MIANHDAITGMEHSPAARVALLDEVRKEMASKSLYKFIELGWSVLEPGRKFVGGWHIGAICEHLEAVTYGEIKRLLINVPPGFMKSLTTNVFWPCWEWGPRNMPHLRYLGFSYSADLSIRDNMRARSLVESPGYKRLWPHVQLASDQNAKVKFDTTAKGYRIATSVGGITTGWRGDRVIIDDPHNVKQAESEADLSSKEIWFTEALPTRMSDPEKSAIIVIMQRVHTRDTSGIILSRDLGYEHLCLPMEFETRRPCYTSLRPRTALGADHKPVLENVTTTPPEDPEERKQWQPGQWRVVAENVQAAVKRYRWDLRVEEGELLWAERFTAEVVARDKKVMGEYASAGQMQQRPAPRGGGLFMVERITMVDALPNKPGKSSRGWDLAASKDKTSPYTVGALLHMIEGSVYIADIKRGRWSPAEVDTTIKTTAINDTIAIEQSIPQDPGQAGVAQKQAFAKLLHGYRVHFSPESGDKETRATPLASQVEAGNVYMLRAPWNEELIAEMTSFPRSTYKDQVDALSRAYSRLTKKAPMTLTSGGEYMDLSGGG